MGAWNDDLGICICAQPVAARGRSWRLPGTAPAVTLSRASACPHAKPALTCSTVARVGDNAVCYLAPLDTGVTPDVPHQHTNHRQPFTKLGDRAAGLLSQAHPRSSPQATRL